MYSGIFQDLRRFSVYVVKLSISDWFYSTGKVVAHSKRSESLLIGFKNGGNDIMYNATITTEDDQFFNIVPRSKTIGNIPSGEIENIEFKIKGLNSTAPGNYSLKYQISYEDFKGGIHKEEKHVSIIVIELGTKISLSYSSNVKYGHKVRFSAKLLDDNNDSVRNGIITFYVESEKIGVTETDSSGIGTLEYEPIMLDVGSYKIWAAYQGSKYFSKSNATGSLIIIQLRTSLELKMPSSIVAKENITFKVILKDEDGKAIQNELVTLYMDGAKIMNSTTDFEGVLNMSHSFPKSGNHSVKALFPGGKNYLREESNLETIRVMSMPTRLSLDMDGVIAKESPAIIKVKLEDKYGAGIKEVIIHLYLNDEKLKSISTDENGVSLDSHQFYSTGIFEDVSLRAEYEGDEAYAKSVVRRNVTIIDIAITGGIKLNPAPVAMAF